MKPSVRYCGAIALLFLGADLSLAQQQAPPQDKTAEKPKEEKKPPAPEEKVVQTKHSLKIGGQEIKYTATAGTILLKLEDGTPKASIFYVAYTKDDVSDPSHRPLTFSFNGGPGSSSVWLHLGLFGPRRVQMGDAGALLPPPYKLVDNDVSLLDISDLVFIDPVSTGYSRAVPGEALPYILYLPTYTAIAWYHKKLPPDLQGGEVQKAIEESRKFAVGEYADALMAGDALPAARRTEIMQKVARLTGVSPDYVDRTNLRIEIQRFTKELLRSERRTIGRIDARFTGIDRDAAGERPEFDPSIAAIIGPYSGMLNDYARNDLKFDSDLPYEVLTGRVRPWNYAPYENRYVNVAETLRGAMTQNPFLHVFVAKGYYDLATPFFAADYTFDHLSLDPTLRGHLSGAYYEAGHMMYVHPPSLAKLKADIAQFIKSSAAANPAK